MEIGTKTQRIDAFDKVTGKAFYPGDINLPNQTYAKVLFSAKPHAIVRNINTIEAEKVEGVLLILTAKDLPNNEYGLIMPDQPVLCGPGSNKKYGDRVRCISDQVAVVVAETEKIAQKALRLIEVEYEDLPVVGSLEEAIQPNVTLVHPEKDTNVLLSYKIRYGAFADWEKEADVIVEGDYETPVQEHAYLQPEAGLAEVEENGKLKIIVAGQWTHEDQEQVAHSLNLPLDQVRIVYPAIGGAFGGREDMSVQIILGLAALKFKGNGNTSPCKNNLVTRGIDYWSPQTPSLRHPFKMGSYKGWQIGWCDSRFKIRCRCLCVYFYQGFGKCNINGNRAL